MSHVIALGSSATEATQESNRDFFKLFLFSLVVVSIPVKNFAYVLPPLYVLAQLLWFDTAAAVRTVLFMATVVTISCTSLFVDAIRGQETNLPGVILGIVTFMPLFIMISARPSMQVDDTLFRRISRCVAWYVIFQTIIGTIQFAASGDPDAVSGTLGLFDLVSGSITITQMYFGFLMISMVLFLMLDWSTWLAKTGIVAGLVVTALSQSGHQSFFFAGALGLFAVLQSRRVGLMLGTGCVLSALVALVLYFYPTTLTSAESWYDKTVNSPDSPKRLSVDGARPILSDPKNLILGTGIGQYSSRAALVSSGEFLSVSLPSVVVGQSLYFRRYLTPGLASFEERGEGSAISKPYFTWLSVVVEFGLVQSVAIAAVVCLTLKRCFRWMYQPCPEVARAGMLGGVAVTFFLLCCMVENYAEFPQAVFIPYLLFVVGSSWAQQTLALTQPPPSE